MEWMNLYDQYSFSTFLWTILFNNIINNILNEISKTNYFCIINISIVISGTKNVLDTNVLELDVKKIYNFI